MKQRKNSKHTKISPVQRIDKWLLLATIFFSRIAAFFASTTKLHNARFARIDELESLMTTQPDKATSLLLGEARMNHVLAVRPQETRSELGNLLVVAPTRGGKGLLAVSQLLSWPHSVVVNDYLRPSFRRFPTYKALR